jgi:hypothetical protein
MRKFAVLISAALAVCVLGVSAASAAKPRLSKAQWAAYVKVHTPYVAQTAKTVAVFRRCRSSTAYTSYMKAFAACLGTAPAKEDAATKTLYLTLLGFQGKTSGACAPSLGAYLHALYFWRSVVVGIERAVRIVSSNVSTVEGQVQNGQLAARKANVATANFERNCKPRTI